MININLVPSQVKEKIKEAKKTADIFSIALIVVIIFGVASFLVRAANDMVLEPNLATVQDQISKSKQELTQFKSLEDQTAVINDRVNLASKIEDKRAKWSQIIQDLINSVPQTVQFVSLNADSTKTPNFVLMGNTTSEQEIVLFKEKLEKSTFFKNVAFKSSTTNTNNANSEENTPKSISFSLEFDLSKFFLNSNSQEVK